jgi:hypothetical protein
MYRRNIHNLSMIRISDTYNLTPCDCSLFAISAAAGVPFCICFLGGGIGGANVLFIVQNAGKMTY